MIIKRVDIQSVLGVSFSKNFNLQEMIDALTQGSVNIQTKLPDLYANLQSSLLVLTNLSKQQEMLVQQAKLLVALKEKIKVADKVFKQVVKFYEVSNQKIVVLNSTIPGTAPTYPTAAIETLPLISAVITAELTLSQLNQQLDQVSQQVIGLSGYLQNETKQINTTIVDQITQSSSTSYDTQVEQFLYT